MPLNYIWIVQFLFVPQKPFFMAGVCFVAPFIVYAIALAKDPDFAGETTLIFGIPFVLFGIIFTVLLLKHIQPKEAKYKDEIIRFSPNFMEYEYKEKYKGNYLYRREVIEIRDFEEVVIYDSGYVLLDAVKVKTYSWREGCEVGDADIYKDTILIPPYYEKFSEILDIFGQHCPVKDDDDIEEETK